MQKQQVKNPVKSSFMILIIAALTVIPIRILQYFTILEPVTGFYSKVDWSVYTLNTLLIFFSVFFILLAVIGKKSISYFSGAKKSNALALASFMFALTLVIASLAEFKDALLTLADPTVAIYQGIFQNLFKTGAGAKFLGAIAAAVSCVYFIIIGVDSNKGSSLAASNKIIALFPVLWCIFRLMQRFMTTINFLNVSDLFYEMVMCVFLMLFFMAFAQANSKISNEGCDYRICAFGFISVVLCLICFIPRFISLCANGSASLALDCPIEWCNLGAAVFIVTALLSRLHLKGDEASPNCDLEETDLEDAEEAPATTEFETTDDSNSNED